MTDVQWGYRGSNHRTCISKNGSPGIDHEGMPMANATSVMLAGLGWRHHEGRVLDGTRLKKNLPVVLSCEGGECGRDHQKLGTGSDQIHGATTSPTSVHIGPAAPTASSMP